MIGDWTWKENAVASLTATATDSVLVDIDLAKVESYEGPEHFEFTTPEAANIEAVYRQIQQGWTDPADQGGDGSGVLAVRWRHPAPEAAPEPSPGAALHPVSL